MKNFLKNIDFKLLKEQKKSLLNVIENTDNVKELEHLEGIVALINAIQDEAVDKYDYKEEKVFDSEQLTN